MLLKYCYFILGQLRSPRAFFILAQALLRGCFYILWFRLKGRTTIKFPFLCHARVEISGPGKVFIDRQCAVWMNAFEHLVIQTLSPEAEVKIGRNCTLGGLTIRCRGKVVIGDNILTAANLVQDVVIAASADIAPQGESSESASSISIGQDVWLGGQTCVLAGSSIGNGTVIGSNGLLLETSVKDNYLAIGNPVMRPVPIEKIIRMQAAAAH